MADDLSRRQFFRLHPVDYLKSGRKADAADPGDVGLFRPPGALGENAFLAACERCGQCAEACPHGVILKLGPAWGRRENTPYLKPEENPCRWCETKDCIEACPSGALSAKGGAVDQAMGKARLQLERCLNAEGILCDTCVQYCPSEVRAIRMDRRLPVLDQDRCVGCGMCAYFCDAVPVAIDMVPTRRIAREQPKA